MPAPKSRPVYTSSTDDDDRDLRRAQPTPGGIATSLPPHQHNLRIRRETSGRGGKTVTTITGFTLTPTDLATLLRQLKQHCGTGGALKADTIELQGDHRDKALAYLKTLGYPAKLAGG